MFLKMVDKAKLTAAIKQLLLPSVSTLHGIPDTTQTLKPYVANPLGTGPVTNRLCGVKIIGRV